MQFTGRQIFWMAFASVALQGLTTLSWGTVPISHDHAWVFTFAASLISYGQGLLLWVIGSQGTKPPGLPIVPPAAKVILLIGAGLVAAIVLMPSNANAQTKLPSIKDIAKQNDINSINRSASSSIGGSDLSPQNVWQKIVQASAADLNYAAALATAANTNGSKIRLQCINALIDANKQASGANLPKNADGTPMVKPDPALVSNIETMAEIVDNLSPQGPLFTSCAGAAQLFRMNVLQLINGIVTGAIGAATIAPIVPIP